MNNPLTPTTISLEAAAKELLQGSVGILPTDTVYGLVACAADQQAVRHFYDLKKRERKPGTLIAANVDQLVGLGIKRRYLSAAEQWWPNPLSVVIPTGGKLEYLDFGLNLAARIPKDEVLRHFLEKTGPLITTSANDPGQPNATTLLEAYGYFADRVDFYVEGGDLADRPPSTVIRIIDDAIEVLRHGAVEIDETGRITNVQT